MKQRYDQLLRSTLHLKQVLSTYGDKKQTAHDKRRGKNRRQIWSPGKRWGVGVKSSTSVTIRTDSHQIHRFFFFTKTNTFINNLLSELWIKCTFLPGNSCTPSAPKLSTLTRRLVWSGESEKEDVCIWVCVCMCYMCVGVWVMLRERWRESWEGKWEVEPSSDTRRRAGWWLSAACTPSLEEAVRMALHFHLIKHAHTHPQLMLLIHSLENRNLKARGEGGRRCESQERLSCLSPSIVTRQFLGIPPVRGELHHRVLVCDWLDSRETPNCGGQCCVT